AAGGFLALDNLDDAVLARNTRPVLAAMAARSSTTTRTRAPLRSLPDGQTVTHWWDHHGGRERHGCEPR
ncbi:MAG: hypothetical protein ACRDSZ_17420, partial [Pseudonocardiaceae bacterium]